MPRISIGDCSLYYERQGMGFPTLFISGLGGFASFWHDQVGAFAKRFEVVTFDHRGIGQSDPARLGYTSSGWRSMWSRFWTRSISGAPCRRAFNRRGDRPGAGDRASDPARERRIFRHLDQGRRVFSAAFHAAQGGAERLGPSIYLQSATLFWYPSWWVARNNERLRQAEAQNLAAFAPTEIVTSRIDAMLAFDRTAELGRIKTPTLVIGAEDDIVTPAYFSEELARLIPAQRSRSSPAAGIS